MPLEKAVADQILAYCDRDLPRDEEVALMFDFIENDKLRERVQAEFQASRYIYKLGEALAASDLRLHAHVKFQIVQYAGIYEAIIVHLLWSKFSEHRAVTEIEFHSTLRKAAALPANLAITTNEGEQIFLCVERTERTPAISIKFDDKVDAAVTIGFIDGDIGEEIKGFYKLRNAIHLESAIRNDTKYEIASSLLAYRRMLPFTRGVRGFLRDGRLPENAKKKVLPAADTPEEIVGA